MILPYRLCCGKQHLDPICLDGLVSCCLCYYRFEIEKLNRFPNGQYEDVCIDCAISEGEYYKNVDRKRT